MDWVPVLDIFHRLVHEDFCYQGVGEGDDVTKSEIASLALKLFGIYCLIQALTFLASSLSLVGMNMAEMGLSRSLMVAGAALPILGYVFAGLILLTFGNKISRKLIADGKEQGVMATGISTRDVQTLAFSIIGIYLIAVSLPSFASILWTLAYYYRKGGPDLARAGIENVWRHAIQAAVEVVVGLGFFLGARGVSSLWFFLQKARGPKLIDSGSADEDR